MHVHELKVKFFQFREYETNDLNELLDFAKRIYIHNEISICEYRSLVRELESLGAVVAWDNIDHSLIENSL
ncbi:YppF family protein [Neobacillus sp. LXY-4]|uniref:YppF family protein n=1 Tax=Neobacillus sp. LXY-4 TaxID=3379826 RepID=UPI003EE33CDF